MAAPLYWFIFEFAMEPEPEPWTISEEKFWEEYIRQYEKRSIQLEILQVDKAVHFIFRQIIERTLHVLKNNQKD